ncbi:MAG: DUF302 domain-containing protein [Pseudomonadota bacterium]
MRRLFLGLALLALSTSAAFAADGFAELPGWEIRQSEHDYATLMQRTEDAVKASPLNVVTKASATVGAKSLGVTIPGNAVLGVYAPDFAIRMLEASVQAGIEAPLRLYVTESGDGTAVLSYVRATQVFAPYTDGGEALATMAAELDAILETIADNAVN